MSDFSFSDWTKKHGLTIEQAAIVLGMSRANAFKYANKTRPVTLYVEYAAEAIDLISPEKRVELFNSRLGRT